MSDEPKIERGDIVIFINQGQKTPSSVQSVKTAEGRQIATLAVFGNGVVTDVTFCPEGGEWGWQKK